MYCGINKTCESKIYNSSKDTSRKYKENYTVFIHYKSIMLIHALYDMLRRYDSILITKIEYKEL